MIILCVNDDNLRMKVYAREKCQCLEKKNPFNSSQELADARGTYMR
jgi:hypothetical protein